MEQPTKEMITLWKNTDAELRGAKRRRFRAGVVRSLGWGGQSFAMSPLGWSRETLRKGEKELATGVDFEDHFQLRGRKRAEDYLPSLLDDIRAIVEPRSQTDPTFKSTRIYTPISAGEVRDRLHTEYNYKLSELPGERTIRNKLNDLGFVLKKFLNAVR
jgi:hypothetical protein